MQLIKISQDLNMKQTLINQRFCCKLIQATFLLYFNVVEFANINVSSTLLNLLSSTAVIINLNWTLRNLILVELSQWSSL